MTFLHARTFPLLLISALFVSLACLAQPSNSLESFKQSLQKQEQTLLEGYGKALDSMMADLKKNGDIDKYLVVETEKKRFETDKTVPFPSNAKDAFKGVLGNYSRSRVVLLKQYIGNLDNLVKAEMNADRMEEAKQAKAEKDKYAFELATLETNLPDVASQKEKLKATDKKEADMKIEVTPLVGRWSYTHNRGGFSAQVEVCEDGMVIWEDMNGFKGTKYCSPLGSNDFLISNAKGIQGKQGWLIVHLPIVNGVAGCDDWGGGINCAAIRFQELKEDEKRKTLAGGYPSIAGKWIYGKDCIITLTQSGKNWQGEGVSKNAKFNLRGTTTVTGVIAGKLDFVKAPSGKKDRDLSCQLSIDGNTISGIQDGKDCGKQPFVWTRRK